MNKADMNVNLGTVTLYFPIVSALILLIFICMCFKDYEFAFGLRFLNHPITLNLKHFYLN